MSSTSHMALPDDEIKVIENRSRKKRMAPLIVGWLLGLLFVIVTVRAITLIFFPHSWLAKYILNW